MIFPTRGDNAEGYAESSLINSANGRKFLLAHDDNVHVSNTMHLVQALVKVDVRFQLVIYPGETQGVAGELTQFHLYHGIHFLRSECNFQISETPRIIVNSTIKPYCYYKST